MKQCKRKKAFLGAIIGSIAGAGLGVAGSAISANKQAKAQEQIYTENVLAANRANALNSASNLNATYGNQEYVDEFNNKININRHYKMGGCKRKSIKRRKAMNGAEFADFSSGVISGLQGLGNSVIQGNTALRTAKYQKPVDDTQSIRVGEAKGEAKAPSYLNGIDYDRMQLYKCGGKRKRKK